MKSIVLLTAIFNYLLFRPWVLNTWGDPENWFKPRMFQHRQIKHLGFPLGQFLKNEKEPDYLLLSNVPYLPL